MINHSFGSHLVFFCLKSCKLLSSSFFRFSIIFLVIISPHFFYPLSSLSSFLLSWSFILRSWRGYSSFSLFSLFSPSFLSSLLCFGEFPRLHLGFTLSLYLYFILKSCQFFLFPFFSFSNFRCCFHFSSKKICTTLWIFCQPIRCQVR